jgi:hypothetical protein
MTKTYTDSQGYTHHAASFEGRRNKLKSLLLLAIRTEPGNKSLSARQLEQLTGLGFVSISASIARWAHWHNHYLNRRGKRRLYRYNLAIYGAEFLEILHRVRPDKEEEYLNIITTNRAKRDSERINIIPKEKSSPILKEKELSPEEETAIIQGVANKHGIVIPKEKPLSPEEDGPDEDAEKKKREELLNRFKSRPNPKDIDKTNGQNS